MKKRLLIVFLIIAVAGLGWGWNYYTRQPVHLSWQGWIEGDFLSVRRSRATNDLLVRRVRGGVFLPFRTIQAAEQAEGNAEGLRRPVNWQHNNAQKK
jgi:hypothetical protein